jgi:hypothetical protein
MTEENNLDDRVLELERFLEERLNILYKNLNELFRARTCARSYAAINAEEKLSGYSFLWNEYLLLLGKFYETHPELKEKRLLREHLKKPEKYSYSFGHGDWADDYPNHLENIK